jgi:DNA replication protein DnaC
VATQRENRVIESLEDLLRAGQARALAAQCEAEEHASACTECPCTRCGRRPCVRCGRPSATRSCPDCATAVARAELLAPALASIPRRFAWASFENPDLVARCGADVVRTAFHARSAHRVALLGPSGAGKTSLAVAMLRSVIEAATPERAHLASSRWVTAHDLARARAKYPLGQGEAPLIADALDARVLVIDELGSEVDPSGVVSELLFKRHDNDAPTWITSWLSPLEIGTKYGGGIARRMLEEGVVLGLMCKTVANGDRAMRSAEVTRG